MTTLDELARPLSMAATTFEDVLAGRPAAFSWQEMLSRRIRRRERSAALDRSASGAGLFGAAARAGARATPSGRPPRISILPANTSARVRLTGSVPMADEEFATVQQGALVNGLATVVVVLVILWLALEVGAHHRRRCSSICSSGLSHHRRARPDDGRRVEHDFGRLRRAVRRPRRRFRHPVFGALPRRAPRCPRTAPGAGAGGGQGRRAADAGGRGGRGRLSCRSCRPIIAASPNLGQIAGVGMLIAYVTSITLLPALLAVIQSAGRTGAGRLSRAGAGRRFLQRHRVPVIVGTVAVAVLGLAAAVFPHLRLRSDPSAQPADRVDLDLARSRQRSPGRHQFDQRRACRRSTPPTAAAARLRKAAASAEHARRCRASCRRIRTKNSR